MTFCNIVVDMPKSWAQIQGGLPSGGQSAGGTLTVAALLMAIDNGGFMPALQILSYPGLDSKTSASARKNGTSNPDLPPQMTDLFYKMYVAPELAGEPYCSPGFAADGQLAKLPPTVIQYCENDLFCDETAEFHKRLLLQGVPVYGKRFFNSSHGFVVRRTDEYEAAEAMILQALRSLHPFKKGGNR